MAKRPGRQRIQLPHCYYEGYLEKRSFRDKTSRNLWTCLCGNTLFFFNNNKDTNYVEKLDLSGFISITDDYSRDRKLDAARLNLRLKDGDIKITAPSLEARELWKAYIHSVLKLSVPSSLNLLPGQINMLKDAVEKEKERIKALSRPAAPPASSSSPYLSLQADMPACYHHVSRMEAVLMLERQPERGNLLLRPGRDGDSFAVTTRQDLDGPLVRHYLVTRKHEGGFTIAVDNPIPCATLHDVIDALVEKTGGVLTPFIMERTYDTNITFIESDKENGEKSVQCASSNPLPVLPKPEPVPVRVPESDTGECLYLNDMPEEKEIEAEEAVRPSPRPRLPRPEKKPSRQAMMPPVPAPRPSVLSSSLPSSTSSALPPSSTDNPDGRMRRLTLSSGSADPLVQNITEELKLKFEKRQACQE
ncbi:signal-transducing adaptor protein 1-like [Centroberyx affinis]|uniref:signal-transducing adaptor protein 1-like n=1 Tax=Centroberyx affinis TaxID=166261 RepID=UPI003A5C1432